MTNRSNALASSNTTQDVGDTQEQSQDAGPTVFAHPSEREFAQILDFYGLRWAYEPRSFPLRWEDDRVVEMLTPDFYLPDLDLYLELTTLKQSLVTAKNRKIRHMREVYPEINIKLLYRRDYHRILAKFGFGPLAQTDVKGIDRVLFTAPQIQRRVAELGRQISRDYDEGLEPVLVGVLRGMLCFMADLMREISLPAEIEFMAISRYGEPDRQSVQVTKDLDHSIQGKHVILVEDIVDSGMTLNFLLGYLQEKEPATLVVSALLDKRARRIVDVPMKYVGFEVPDEFVVGYGLDYLEKYRNLPFIGALRPDPK
jgi:hypoxanthine phosphoribosyltransferase